MSSVVKYLNRWLEPVAGALNPEAVEQLLRLKADVLTEQRVEELADRNAEGLLTPEERSEYEALVTASEIVASLQARCRP